MFDDIKNSLSTLDEGEFLDDIELKKYSFPLIYLHSTGIFVFLNDGSFKDKGNKKVILDKIYFLQNILNVSRGKMWVYSIDDNNEWTWINPYNDDIEIVENPAEHALSFIHAGIFNFEDSRLAYFADKLSFSEATDEKIKTNNEGQTFVKKGGQWYLASDEDTDEVFMKTCIFGVFGWFQFHIGKWLSGIFYLLTCGFFGFGWIFDILHFLIGYARDRDGYYYVPISNKKQGFLIFLGCCAAAILLVFIYMKFAGVVNNIFSHIMEGLMSSSDLESQLPKN